LPNLDSPVFRNLLDFLAPDASGHHNPIILSDDAFEHSTVIRLVLDILDGSYEAPEQPQISWYKTCNQVIHFAKKWELKTVRKAIFSIMGERCINFDGSNTQIAAHAFIIGAIHSELSICLLVLRTRASHFSWMTYDDDRKKGHSILDPKGWPMATSYPSIQSISGR
jgi:hypothetical protein